MIVTGITVEDVKNIAERRLVLQLPGFKEIVSTRNLISYVSKAYPLPGNLAYRTTTEGDNLIIEVYDKFEDVSRK